MSAVVGICGVEVDLDFQRAAQSLAAVFNVGVVRRDANGCRELDGLV